MTNTSKRPENKQPMSEQPTLTKKRLINTALPVFWLLFAINTVNYLDRFLAVAVAPTLKQEFHLTDGNIGALSSAFILIYAVASLPLGLLADRASRARVVAAGVSLWSIASGVTGLANGLPLLFATRAGVGIGEASYYPAGTALLSAYYSLERRARALSRWSSGQLFGVALAFGIAAGLSALLGPSLGWRVAFIFSAVPGFILAALMWFVADAPATAPDESSSYAAKMNEELETRPAKSVRLILRDVARIRTVWVVAVLQALSFVVITPAVTFLPIYLRSTHGPFHLSAVTTDALAGIVIIVGGLTGQVFGGNVGRMLTTTVGFGIALPTYALMLLTHSLPVFVIFGIIAVLAINLPIGPMLACSQDATPRALRATALAMTLLIGHLGGDAWSPWATGQVSTKLGEHIANSLLIFGIPALALAAIIGLVGTRIYAAEVSPGSESKGHVAVH